LVLDRLAEIVPFDRGSVMLLSGDEMEIVAAKGFPEQARPHQIRIPVVGDDNDIFRQIYLTQRPLSIPDVSQRPDFQYVEGLPPARSWLGVPLIHQNAAMGMLSLARESPLPYTDDEIMLATAFAGQAAIGLQNARLYDSMKQAYAQLERLDRTKSDFIGVASHELRTPLTSLRGSSQILLNDPDIKENPLHQELVSTIYSGAVRLHEIVDSMLDMIKIDSRALQLYHKPLSVPTLIQTVCNGFARSVAERNLTLTVEDIQGLPEIEADRDALRKVFGNLVVNAIKYTPDGGRITISGRAVARGEKDLPEGIEVVVSDTGIGIDPKSQELIFTKFYQTGELALHSTSKTQFKGGGPGLGLAVARGIVEAHGGKLWVESPGCDEKTCPGSKFYVFLPLRQRRQVRPPSDPLEG
jgi:signal transduction histidine kinase